MQAGKFIDSTHQTLGHSYRELFMKLIPFSFVSAIALAFPLSLHAAQAFTPVTSGGMYAQQLQANAAQSGSMIAAAGAFVAAEKPTTGTAYVVIAGRRRYLVLDAAFQTSDQGPDLHVVLDPTEQPPAQYKDMSQIVDLGKLKKYSGTQRYAIPSNVDLSKIKSVGIWCRMANATFGYAQLSAPANR